VHVGDTVVRFEEDHPRDERALLRDITGNPPGRMITLGVIRAGQPVELPVTLGEWPRMAWEEANAPLKVQPPHWVIPADLGLKATELTDAVRSTQAVPAAVQGVLVTEVGHDTDAARRGVVAGDVIMQVGDVPVATASALFERIGATRKAGHDMAMLLIFPKNKGASAFASPKWLPVRLSAN
jgi:serine protease Do